MPENEFLAKVKEWAAPEQFALAKSRSPTLHFATNKFCPTAQQDS
jgi:hypothetical protein